MTFPSFRKRVSPNPLGTTDAAQSQVSGPYVYHMGDLFTPGAHIYAFDMGPAGTGIPETSAYGRGGIASVCCRKYEFSSFGAQLTNVPTYTLVNITNGGVGTGTFTLTSLIQSQNAML